MALIRIALTLCVSAAIPSILVAQWSSDPATNTPVCIAPGTQALVTLNPVNGGGAILSWEDNRSGGSKVYTQKLDSAGHALWTPNGLAISATGGNILDEQPFPAISAVGDGAGGQVYAWASDAAPNYNLYVQRIDSSGAKKWGEGTIVTPVAMGPHTAPDGTGGCIVVFVHGTIVSPGVISFVGLRAQRVDGSGNVMWTAGGIVLSPSATWAGIVSDNAGGAIVGWEDDDPSHTGVFAQRFDSSGNVLWQSLVIPLVPGERDLSMTGDGSGGAILTWHQTSPSNTKDIHAQRLDASGTALWPPGGATVDSGTCTELNFFMMASDGAGGALIAWPDNRTSGYLHAFVQRIDASGNAVWTTNGIRCSAGTTFDEATTVTSDGSGGAIVTWNRGNVQGQHIDSGGSKRWGQAGMPIGTNGAGENSPKVISDQHGGAIAAWDDFRSGGADTYAQQVSGIGWLADYSPGPQGLHSVSGSTKVALAWQGSTDSYFLRYRIYADTVPHPIHAIDSTAGGPNDTLKIIGGLTDGVAYYFRLTAVDTGNIETDYSNEVTVTPHLGQGPENLTAAGGNSKVMLTWSMSTDPYFRRYRIYDDTIPHPVSLADSTNGGNADTARTIGHLSNGVAYFFRITTVNIYGFESDYSNEVTATPSFVVAYHAGWNLISLPVIMGDYHTSSIFPTTTGSAYSYEQGSYRVRDTLSGGFGYWVKFSGDTDRVFAEKNITTDTIPVRAGWNMIGSVGKPVRVATISSVPPGLVTSSFYGYGENYSVADTIKPGMGYWIHTNADGELILSSQPGNAGRALATIQIEAGFAFSPPPPPEIQTIDTPLPASFQLAQNYPNPFNPVTIIDYSLPADAEVSIDVYDALGQLVVQLIHARPQAAGYQRIAFNADKLPSGVYYYRLTAGRFTEFKKMVLLK
jgi:hypothetical protein